MAPIRSKRLRALDGMCRTLCDRLHQRVFNAARARGWMSPPDNTSAIYTLALAEAPALLDQLLTVHRLADREREYGAAAPAAAAPATDSERKKMLSAIRASISRTNGKLARS